VPCRACMSYTQHYLLPRSRSHFPFSTGIVALAPAMGRGNPFPALGRSVANGLPQTFTSPSFVLWGGRILFVSLSTRQPVYLQSKSALGFACHRIVAANVAASLKLVGKLFSFFLLFLYMLNLCGANALVENTATALSIRQQR